MSAADAAFQRGPVDLSTPALVRASDSVNIADLHTNLQVFMAWLANAHKALFNCPLVVTSGKDAIHGTGSKHYSGRAFDMRTHDKSDLENSVLIIVICAVSAKYGIACFDERALGAEAHIHIELAG